MVRFLRENAGNPGRAGHRFAVAAEAMIDDLRRRLTQFIGGSDPHRLIFTASATDSLNLAIKGVLLPTGGHVVTTVLEHNSVARPLRALEQAGRITLTRVNCDEQGFVAPAAIADALRPDTKLIALTHASNVLGSVQDIAAVGALAQQHGALLLVDAAQTLGVVPLDVHAIGIDLLAFPGHKGLQGPTGVGGLHLGARLGDATQLAPWREGGTGGDSASPLQPRQLPHYLEAGTPNTVGLAGLAAAVQDLTPTACQSRWRHEQTLRAQLHDALAADARFTVLGPTDSTLAVGVLSFTLTGYQPEEVAAILDESFHIAVRAGLHCAPDAHRAMGAFPEGAVRVSFGPGNTRVQVERLLDALRQIAG